MQINADQLKRLRLEKGLRQIDLAHAASLSRAYISMIEAGLRPSVSARTAARLAGALDASVNELAKRPPRLRARQ